MDIISRIYVAGHQGLVGSALTRRLGISGHSNIIVRTHSELDLEDSLLVSDFFAAQRPEYVFLAAAKVGGILANSTYPVEFLLRNIKIQINVIEAAWRHGTKGLLFLGSSCIYPKLAPQPLREEYLLTGPLEPTNEAYAIAKIAGIELCAAYNRQYGAHFLSVMPTNLYGPNDSYDLENSHVLPAFIRKFHLAKSAAAGDWEAITRNEAVYGRIPADFAANLAAISSFHSHTVPESFMPRGGGIEAGPAVKLWGTGSPRREFLYADDLADACVFLMGKLEQLFDNSVSHFTGSEHLINIGCGDDITIRELAGEVARIAGFDGPIQWDASKPDGTPRKLLDVGKINRIGWKHSIGLDQGIRLAYADYLSKITNYSEPKKAI
ncbi:MAG: GDP-L-fucose synthase [Syntrophobacteraceae bacterium]|jgi:GDP-L-fucose synthase